MRIGANEAVMVTASAGAALRIAAAAIRPHADFR
jgi:hypothetical protein